MSDALIVPLHFAGWEHFTESLADLEAAFAAAGLTSRLLVQRPESRSSFASRRNRVRSRAPRTG